MAFHPYPQVIPMVFSPYGFGPPLGFTRASTCSWIDHPVSGLPRRTVRPIQTRFRCGSGSLALTSHDKETRWLIMQKARSHRASPARTACRQSVSGSIALPSQGFFSPFPHGTGSLSVAKEYLALEDGPPGFPRGFTCLVVLRNLQRHVRSRVRGFHPL